MVIIFYQLLLAGIKTVVKNHSGTLFFPPQLFCAYKMLNMTWQLKKSFVLIYKLEKYFPEKCFISLRTKRMNQTKSYIL